MSSFSTVTKRQIIGNISALVSGMVVARIMSAVIIILIARRIGPDSFGQYAASFAVAKLTSVLFTLGVDVWLLRNGNRAGDAGLLAKHSSSCLSIKAILGTGWLIGMALIGPNLNQDVFPFAILMLAAVSVWLDEQSSTIWNSFKSGMRNKTASSLIVIAQSIFFGITMVLLLMGTDTLLPFVVGQMAASILGAGIAYWQFRREIGISFDRASVVTILREAFPYALSMALALIYGKADITIIGHWLGETAVGFYSPAVSLIGALVLLPEASYTTMLPILSQFHSQNKQRMIFLSRWLVGLSILGGLIVAGGLIVVSNPLVNLVYGARFAPSAEVLRILSGVLALRFISFALGAIVVAVGWQSYRVIAQALSAGLNVGLNLLIVVSVGIVGVAKVYVASEIVLMLGYLILVLLWQRGERQQSILTSTPAG